MRKRASFHRTFLMIYLVGMTFLVGFGLFYGVVSARRGIAERGASLKNGAIMSAISSPVFAISQLELSTLNTPTNALDSARIKGANLTSIFGEIKSFVGSVFSKDSQEVFISPEKNAGLVVIPVPEDANRAELAARLADTFSDEVIVLPDEAGGGVVRPIFKHVIGDDYIYILTPAY